MEDLHASNSQLQWIIDSYTIVFAGLLLTTGSLGDRFGRKRLLTIGIVLFGIGSAASALQSTAEGLILTRAFMGIGGAMIMPSTLSILTNVFRDPRERGKAIGDLGRLLRRRHRRRPVGRWAAAAPLLAGARSSGSTSRSASRR